MPAAEKANLKGSADISATPASAPSRDLPPSYENAIQPLPIPPTPNAIPPSIPVSIPSQNPLEAIARLKDIDFPKYCVAESKLSDDSTTVTTTKAELSATQYVLVNFIQGQAALPPKPLMVIRGTHIGGLAGSAKYGEPFVDFELKINLTSLLNVDQDVGRNGIRSSSRIRVAKFENQNSSPKLGHGRESKLGPLQQWVKMFCEDKAENKSFTIHRSVHDLPTQILEGMVRTLIAATKYRGKVAVEFPTHYSDVTVVRQSSNWFANMLRLYRMKRYDVVESVWDVSGSGAQSAGNDGFVSAGEISSANTEQSRRAGLVAQEWWREWQGAVWNAVLARKQGWVTVEDWIEARMGVREKERSRDWGIDYEQTS